MGNIFIYGLYGSNDIKTIKYVGKTRQNIKKRIHDHIRESLKLKTKKDKWIQSVITSGYNIEYKIIEQVDKNSWNEREKYWINCLPELTNTSKGGDGGRGLLATKTYNELKEFVHIYMKDIKNSIEWKGFVKKNLQYDFLPKNPYISYKNRGWISWKDLLPNYEGIVFKRNAYRQFFSYSDCKEYLKVFKISGRNEFKKIKIFDIRVPSQPDNFYKKRNEWISWMDFLSH